MGNHGSAFVIDARLAAHLVLLVAEHFLFQFFFVLAVLLAVLDESIFNLEAVCIPARQVALSSPVALLRLALGTICLVTILLPHAKLVAPLSRGTGQVSC